MYLKNLSLKGFKSFAEGTVIQFQQGLNIMVGPNGCGKSNIVDAIRWVLGEGNIRILRGQRGEDVIFTGTDVKRPLGLASVAMTIENEARELDVDYTEVTVERKVFRDGESEFYLNRNKVRMRDIQALFAGTGLGKKGYSIIGQGELEQILNAKPYDRRLILEEAAGLSLYRQKKEEAQHKLQNTDQDLIRLQDIMGELETRLAELEDRAAQARKYLDLNARWTDCIRKTTAYDITVYQAEVSSREREMQEFDHEMGLLQQQVERDEQELQVLNEKSLRLEQELTGLKDEYHRMDAELSRLLSEERLAGERVRNAETRKTRLEADLIRYQAMMDKIEEDLRLAQEELELKAAEIGQRRQELAALESEMAAEESAWQDQSQTLEALKNELFELLNREASLNNRFLDYEEKIKRQRDKLARNQDEIKFKHDRQASLRERLDILNLERTGELHELKRLETESQKMEQEKKQLAAYIADINAALGELEKNQRQTEHEITLLEEAARARTGFSEGVRRLLAHRQEFGLLGVVAELIEVPEGWEYAFEVALGRSLENIVTRTAEDAQRAIELLKAKSWGRVTFLPLNSLKPYRHDARRQSHILEMSGVVGLGSELVRCAPEFQPVVQHLLGDVLLAENLDVALKVVAAGTYHKIVTIEGDIIYPSGAMTGGKSSAHSNHAPLRRKGEIAAQKKALEAIKNQARKLAREMDGLRARQNEADKLWSEIQQKLTNSIFRRDMIEQEIKQVENELQKLADEIDGLKSQEKIGLKEIEVLTADWENIKKEKLSLTDVSKDKSVQIEFRKEELEQRSRKCELQRERYQHLFELVEAQEKELERQDKSVQQLETVKSSYRSTLQEAEAEMAQLLAAVERESQRIAQFKGEGAALEERKRICSADSERVEQELRAVKTEMEKMRTALFPVRERISRLENKKRTVELKKVRAEIEFENALSNWNQKFSAQEYTEYLGIDARTYRDLKKTAEILKEELEALETVNLHAISELEEVNARYRFLESQMTDLTQARHSLQRIIEESERQMNRRFSEFLSLANVSFKKTFTDIFMGGEAELVLDNLEDSWETGVEILVKMPGKKRQHLNSLSGGERALTCIAFIFALLILKPVPFCLFDEIDSSLDEVNLVRFNDFLKRLSTQIQFIIITHRQKTIETGDVIYGVTMPQQGVSSVLTLSLKEAQSLAV